MCSYFYFIEGIHYFLSLCSLELIGVVNALLTSDKWEAIDVGQEGLCHDECYVGLGGVQVCVVTSVLMG